jgi:hypothetical protein
MNSLTKENKELSERLNIEMNKNRESREVINDLNMKCIDLEKKLDIQTED